ncbi:lysozyme [Anaerocolumna jejuensis]|uniref:lysozyme n=1 Tax=Anaerocolumna jejuensis TaxID=259063 RepID=UPI003F7B8EDC
MNKTTSTAGITILKKFEGCRLVAYKALPTEQYYTIGYGHYGADVKQNMAITLSEAETMLKNDLKDYEKAVSKYVLVDITQNMFDALVSFSYNCGTEALKKSTLLKLLNKNDYIGAAEQFKNWNKSGGKTIPGLTERRGKEKDLFLNGYCDKPTAQVSKTTATAAETRWIQYKLGGLSIDGLWGAKTAEVIRAKRKALEWEETTGNVCTVNLTKVLGK